MNIEEILAKHIDEEGKLDKEAAAKEIKKEQGKEFVPKTDFNEKNDALTKANETITNLETNNKSNEDLQTEIENYKTEIETLNTQNEVTRKQSAIDLALVKVGAKNPKAVNALLDGEKIELTDDGIKGLDEQLEGLQESDGYLFQVAEDDKGPQIQPGGDPNGDDQEEDDSLQEFINNRYK